MSADTDNDLPIRTWDEWDEHDAEAVLWLDFELGHVDATDADDWYAASVLRMAERAPA